MDDLDFDLTVAHDEGGATRLTLRGELDLATAARLEQALAQSGDDVLLDLRGLTFMDSTGLALILRYHQRAKDGRFDLVVVRGPEPVDRVFRMTQADAMLEMLDVPPAAAER
jgi:anti-anti-sigma factor